LLSVGILRGDKVKGHPELNDGDDISTSPLLYLIGGGPGRYYAKTCNRWYRLMDPKPTFLEYIESSGKQLYFPNGILQNRNRAFKRNTDGAFEATFLEE
jgi:hypothetical protein